MADISKIAYPGAVIEQRKQWIVRKCDDLNLWVNSYPERPNEVCIPIGREVWERLRIIDTPTAAQVDRAGSGRTAVAYDVETGGMDARIDALVEIAAVEFDLGSGETVSEFKTLVNPPDGLRLLPGAVNTHGYDRAKLRGQPSEKDAVRAFHAWSKGRAALDWWSHSNNDFDYRFLIAAARRNMPPDAAPDWDWPWADKRKSTIQRFKDCGVFKNLGLKALALEYCGAQRSGDTHGALEDASILARLVSSACAKVEGFDEWAKLDVA